MRAQLGDPRFRAGRPSPAGSLRRRTGRSAGPNWSGPPAAAEAPGAAMTGWPASRAARTSLKPGSDTSGVPASETRATASPCGEPRQELGPRRCGVVLVVGGQRRRNAVVVEQPARDAGVLAGDDVGRGERFQRPDGDVAQVPDRGCDKMQAGREPRGLDRPARQRCRSLADCWPEYRPDCPAWSALYRPAGTASSLVEGIPYPFHSVNLSSS